jgi:hypothetical protein
MNYISFVVITSTPGLLATFLASRGIIEQKTDARTGQTYYVGVRPGMEWVRVPNPIVTGGAGTVGDPYIYDTRAVFLVKLAHESVDNEEEVGFPTSVDGEPVNQYDWSKFGRWVKNNSSIVSAPVNYTINGVHAGDAYKITGEQVWLIRDNPDRFGVWQ